MMAKKRALKTKFMRDVSVSFGGVSIGKKTARIAMKMERDESFALVKIDEELCGRRLTGKIQLGRKGDTAGQTTIWNEEQSIAGTFDVTALSMKPTEFGFGATFKKTEIDLALLGDFSNGEGRMRIESVSEIPVDKVEEKETENGSIPGTYKSDAPWAKISMDSVFEGSKLKALKGAGIETVGDYADYFKPAANGFTKKLVDIKGIGEKAATFIEDRMLEVFRDNPTK